MKVLITPNMRKDDAMRRTEDVISRFRQLGCECLLGSQFSYIFSGCGARFGEYRDLLSEANLLVAIGGDGTIIHCAKDALDVGVPILGINLGRVGFLAQLELSQLDLLEDIVQGHYRIQERMLLEAIHITQEKKKHTYRALNDFVFSKGALSRMVDLMVDAEAQTVGHFRSDGLIFATPTGSTAYSMSAGGPIIDPEIDCIVMTPICPHTLSSRPIIFSPEQSLCIRQMIVNYADQLYMTVDGEQAVIIRPEESVEIHRCKKRVKLVAVDRRSFYEVLNDKLCRRI